MPPLVMLDLQKSEPLAAKRQRMPRPSEQQALKLIEAAAKIDQGMFAPQTVEEAGGYKILADQVCEHSWMLAREAEIRAANALGHGAGAADDLRLCEMWSDACDAAWKVQAALRALKAQREAERVPMRFELSSYNGAVTKSFGRNTGIEQRGWFRQPGAVGSFVSQSRKHPKDIEAERYMKNLYTAEGMPKPTLLTASLSKFYEATDVVKGLGMPAHEQNVWAARLDSIVKKARIEVDFRKSLHETLREHYDELPKYARNEIARRALAFYRTVKQSERLSKAFPPPKPGQKPAPRPGAAQRPSQGAKPGMKKPMPGEEDRVSVHPPGKDVPSSDDVHGGGTPEQRKQGHFDQPGLDVASLDGGPTDPGVITMEVEKLHKQLHALHAHMDGSPAQIHLHNDLVANMRECYAKPSPELLRKVRHELHHFAELVQGPEEPDPATLEDPNADPDDPNAQPPAPGVPGGKKMPGKKPPGAPMEKSRPFEFGRLFIGAAFSKSEADDIEKGATHKYLRRIPTGNPRRPYRYVYNINSAARAGAPPQVGEKVLVPHAGVRGHFEVKQVRDDGRIRVQHDETGQEMVLHAQKFHDLLNHSHEEGMRARHEAEDALPKNKLDAYRMLLQSSGINDHDFAAKDMAYETWKRGATKKDPEAVEAHRKELAAWKEGGKKGPKPKAPRGERSERPKAWRGGELDAMNEGAGKKFSSMAEAFEKMAAGAKTWRDIKTKVIPRMREVPGFERVHLPMEVVTRHAFQDQDRAEAEDEFHPQRYGEAIGDAHEDNDNIGGADFDPAELSRSLVIHTETIGGGPFTRYLFIKSMKGEERPGHKYIKRTPRAGGGYDYVYADEHTKDQLKAMPNDSTVELHADQHKFTKVGRDDWKSERTGGLFASGFLARHPHTLTSPGLGEVRAPEAPKQTEATKPVADEQPTKHPPVRESIKLVGGKWVPTKSREEPKIVVPADDRTPEEIEEDKNDEFKHAERIEKYTKMRDDAKAALAKAKDASDGSRNAKRNIAFAEAALKHAEQELEGAHEYVRISREATKNYRAKKRAAAEKHKAEAPERERIRREAQDRLAAAREEEEREYRTRAPSVKDPNALSRQRREAIGEHIDLSAKDRADWRKLVETGDLSNMSFSDAFRLVNKKNAMPAYTLDHFKAMGASPGAAKLGLTLASLVGANPREDSDESRRHYLNGIKLVRGILESATTAADYESARKELRDMVHSRAGKPIEVIHKAQRFTAAEKAARAKDASLSYRDKYADYRDLDRPPGNYAQEVLEPDVRKKDDDLRVGTRYDKHHNVEFFTYSFKKLVDDAHAMLGLGKRFVDQYIDEGKIWRDAQHTAHEAEKAGVAGWGHVAGEGERKESEKRAREEKGGGGETKFKWRRSVSEKPAVIKPSVEVKEANPERLASTFGFRGLQRGEAINAEELAHHHKYAEMAFHDLAHALGLQPKHVSMKGRLALAFAARGKGGARAHYEPDMKAINITRFLGAGSLAHEWGHFLDNVIAEQYGTSTRGGGSFASLGHSREGMTPELRDAVSGVMDAMNKPSADYVAKSKEYLAELNGHMKKAHEALRAHPASGWEGRNATPEQKADYNAQRVAAAQLQDQRDRVAKFVASPTSRYAATSLAHDQGKPGYYSQPEEMWARAFESYVQDKIEDTGGRNSYLVDGTRDSLGPYPTEDERERINGAFDKLISVLKAGKHFEKALKLFIDLAKTRRSA